MFLCQSEEQLKAKPHERTDQRSEQALLLAMMKMVVNGVSTWKVKTLQKNFVVRSFPNPHISPLQETRPIVHDFRTRPLESHYPFFSWGKFFSSLKERGLKDVDLVTSDDYKGLVKAVQRHF